MEVHHHSHTARKKWTHYFWEFLMLFLAVFCGFLAEYQLEHKIEKERGMQYIRSFYEDLKTDTAEFSFLIKAYEIKLSVFLNRNTCFNSLSTNAPVTNTCIRELINHSNSFPDMVTADQTLMQLKNAGGLRLLKKADADSILAYDKLVRIFTKSETTSFQESQNRMRESNKSILSYRSPGEKDEQNFPFLISGDKDKLNRFFVGLNEYSALCNDQHHHLLGLNQLALNLLSYLKNKYKLN